MRVFASNQANQILSKAGKLKLSTSKTLYIFAGPNGSGKSTLIANHYLDGKLEVEYVNADLYCKELFNDEPDENERNIKAMHYCMDKVEKYIDEGVSFCYETVLSHPSKLELARKAKEKGYKIISTFVYTSSPEINISRVAKRVTQGGHDVSNDKIVSRYYRSIENAKMLENLSTEFYKFDNSKEMETVVIEETDIEKL